MQTPIPVAEACRRLDDLALRWGTTRLPLESAAGRVLAEPLRADRDFPPFDRVAMDGIAISAGAAAEGRRDFAVIGIQAAGDPPLAIKLDGEAVEVMTGAVLPGGTAAVVPVEDLEGKGPRLRLREGVHVRSGQNIHGRASDAPAGSVLVPEGQVLHGPALAVAASVGATAVEVRGRPRIAVLSTGSELVDVSETPAPHQIRVSNLSALRAGLELDGHPPSWTGRVSDDRALLARKLSTLFEAHDVVVLSGGVSQGRYDHVPSLLEDLGCCILFHGVKQRPGRPLLAATGREGQLVLALPGNPVSSVVCLHRFLLPLLRRREGRPATVRRAHLAKPVRWGRPLSLFLACSLEDGHPGLPMANPLPSGGSGDLASLAGSDGFLELEEGRAGWEAGDEATFWPWAPR